MLSDRFERVSIPCANCMKNTQNRPQLLTKRTWDKFGIPRATFTTGMTGFWPVAVEALANRSPRPSWVWTRISEPMREKFKKWSLNEPLHFLVF